MSTSRLYSIDEAREILGRISRDKIYDLLRTGKLVSTVIGRRRFISQGALDAYVAANTAAAMPAPRQASGRPGA
jgi:excisionase family DNA binding protein